MADEMNENQIVCWHYVMDIHQPNDIWHSTTYSLYELEGAEISEEGVNL